MGIFCYQHHIVDWRTATAHLSLEERGIYRELMDAYYATSGNLPTDLTAIYRTIGAQSASEKRATVKILSQFFEKKSEIYSHKRCDEELTRIAEKSEKASQSAKLKHLKDKNTSSANAQQTQSEGTCENDANGLLTINNEQLKKEKIQKKKEADTAEPEWWPKFWEAYPRRDGRHKALEAWRRAVNAGADPENLVCCAQTYAMRCGELKTERQFIKMPQTWLNGKCWEDEQETVDAANDVWTEFDQWRLRMGNFVSKGIWVPEAYGARPKENGCNVPPEILREFGFIESTPSHKSESANAV